MSSDFKLFQGMPTNSATLMNKPLIQATEVVSTINQFYVLTLGTVSLQLTVPRRVPESSQFTCCQSNIQMLSFLL